MAGSALQITRPVEPDGTQPPRSAPADDRQFRPKRCIRRRYRDPSASPWSPRPRHMTRSQREPVRPSLRHADIREMYRSVRAHGLVGDDANEALFVMGVVLAGSLTNEPKSAALRASRHPDRPPHRVAAYGDAPWRTPRPSHQPALSEQTDGLRDAGASADARLHTRVTMHLLVANFEHPVLASSGKHPSPKHKSAMPSAQAGSGVRQLSPSPKLSGATPPNRASCATIAFLESDRPDAPEPAMPMATERSSRPKRFGAGTRKPRCSGVFKVGRGGNGPGLPAVDQPLASSPAPRGSHADGP